MNVCMYAMLWEDDDGIWEGRRSVVWENECLRVMGYMSYRLMVQMML